MPAPSTRNAQRGRARASSGHAAEDRVAVTPAMASRLVDVSEARLRNWERIHLQNPAVSRRLSERNTVRLYDFQDVLSLLVVRELLNQKMTTLQINKVVQHLNSVGYKHPLAELTFAIDGNEIFFQHPDGTWEGSRRKNQIVMERVLKTSSSSGISSGSALMRRSTGRGTTGTSTAARSMARRRYSPEPGSQ